jgi:hypothetical protein
VPGVVGIDNAITLTRFSARVTQGTPSPPRFRCDALLDADGLSVETFPGGLVILSGRVPSWAAHDRAVAAARSAPGVTQVDDRIRVGYAAP